MYIPDTLNTDFIFWQPQWVNILFSISWFTYKLICHKPSHLYPSKWLLRAAFFQGFIVFVMYNFESELHTSALLSSAKRLAAGSSARLQHKQTKLFMGKLLSTQALLS